jgi:hypothetical protein
VTHLDSHVTLGPLKKLAVLLVPWGFLLIFAIIYAFLVLPRLREGQLAALCLGGIAALVFTCFFVAAITFSRDVVSDRWPELAAENTVPSRAE